MSSNNIYTSDKARRRNADPSDIRRQTEEHNFLSDCAAKVASIHIGDIETIHAKTTTGGLIDLKDVTFIIPIKIDSNDRLQNFNTTIAYLTKNLDTNIIVYEMDADSKLRNNVPDVVTYVFEKNDSPTFHRTRYLNHMLFLSKTPVTVNYDIDVILPVESYVKARDMVINDGIDLIYPYGYGNFQHKVNKTGRAKILSQSSIDKLIESDFDCMYYLSWFGHCQFFNTETYRRYGGENEYFVSYGPEDFERYTRFKGLGTKVCHLENQVVYHLEHERGSNSNSNNPYFSQNDRLYNILKNKSKEYLEEYYTSTEYIKKYFK